MPKYTRIAVSIQKTRGKKAASSCRHGYRGRTHDSGFWRTETKNQIQVRKKKHDIDRNKTHLSSHADSLLEGRGTGGANHELLHGKAVAGMGASVDHVHPGDGHDELAGVASEIGKMLVERNALSGSTSLGDSEGNGKDGVLREIRIALRTEEDGGWNVLTPRHATTRTPRMTDSHDKRHAEGRGENKSACTNSHVTQ
jgi:hypothetical protein